MRHSEIKKYYERSYAISQGETFPSDEARYRNWFGPMLNERRLHAQMLDVGCGHGYVCSLFARLEYSVAGVDISLAAIESARRLEPEGHFEEAKESGELPFASQHFDVVACLGVLEHIPDPEKTLREMRRVCRPGGLGVWVLPNSSSPYFWFGGGTGQIEETPRTLAQWKNLLEASGWRIERVTKDPGPIDLPSVGTKAWTKRVALKLINFLPISLTYQFVIHARPVMSN